ncbi:hypothetical protein QOT17_020211 [Balamuthia mandrillaris]
MDALLLLFLFLFVSRFYRLSAFVKKKVCVLQRKEKEKRKMEFVEEELEKVIEEHSFGVNSIRVSEDAPSELRSRVTVRTLENNTFLVELIPTRGFRVIPQKKTHSYFKNLLSAS